MTERYGTDRQTKWLAISCMIDEMYSFSCFTRQAKRNDYVDLIYILADKRKDTE